MNKFDKFALSLAIYGIVYFAFFVIGKERLRQDSLWLVALATVFTIIYINIRED